MLKHKKTLVGATRPLGCVRSETVKQSQKVNDDGNKSKMAFYSGGPLDDKK